MEEAALLFDSEIEQLRFYPFRDPTGDLTHNRINQLEWEVSFYFKPQENFVTLSEERGGSLPQ